MSSSRRIAYYDVLRVVAIWLVLYCHLPCYHLFHTAHGAWLFLALPRAVVTRIGVLLFSMVSGTLLLGRNEDYSTLWNKRIKRMLLVILIFESCLYVEDCLVLHYPISFQKFVYMMFGGTLRHFSHFWFLYAYTGFLFMLPFLRRVAQSMTKADFIWLFCINLAMTTGMTIVNYTLKLCDMPRLELSGSFSVALGTVSLFFYPLIGYWIDRNVDVRAMTRRQWTLLLGVTALGIALGSLMTWNYQRVFGEFSQNYLSVTVVLTTVSVFLIIKRLFGPEFTAAHPRLCRVFTFVASLVFGVYLLDQGLKLVLYEPIKAALVPTVGVYFFGIAWCALSVVCGGALTWILKRLPLFRNIL